MPPETGASTICIPFLASACPIALVLVGDEELISIERVPLTMRLARGLGPVKTTKSRALPSGSIVMTALAPATASTTLTQGHPLQRVERILIEVKAPDRECLRSQLQRHLKAHLVQADDSHRKAASWVLLNQ